jgi:hypothetical protein
MSGMERKLQTGRSSRQRVQTEATIGRNPTTASSGRNGTTEQAALNGRRGHRRVASPPISRPWIAVLSRFTPAVPIKGLCGVCDNRKRQPVGLSKTMDGCKTSFESRPSSHHLLGVKVARGAHASSSARSPSIDLRFIAEAKLALQLRRF